MAVDDRLVGLRRRQSRHQPRRDRRRHRQDDLVVRRQRQGALVQLQRDDAVVLELQRLDPHAGPDRDAVPVQVVQCRVDEGVGQVGAGDQRDRLRPALGQGLLHHRPQAAGRGLVGRGVEGGDGERLDQAAIQLARRHHAGHGVVRPGLGQPAQRQVVARPGPRHPAAGQQHPPGQPAAVRAHGEFAVALQVDEAEAGPGRRRQPVAGADQVEIAPDVAVAGQHQVVAVVDHPVQRRLVEGAAAAAGPGRGLVHHRRDAGAGELDRGGEAGQPAADHMHRHFSSTESRMPIFSRFDRRGRTDRSA